jgi:hypothetical protein
MKHLSIFIILITTLFQYSCSETIYIEIPEDDDFISTTCAISIYHWSVTHIDGTPYVEADGMITNRGPSNIKNIRIIVSSNYGDTRMTRPTPHALEVDEIGSWSVHSVPGTYIQSKAALFEEDG